MYDQETRDTTDGNQRKIDVLRDVHGKHHPVHLRFGYGVCVSVWPVRKTNRQSRNIQDAFTRFFYSYRRHDWIPVWYQTDGR